MPVHIPTYLPLREAAEKYRVDPDVLTRAVRDGKIKAVRINGGFALAEGEVKDFAERRRTVEELRRKYAHLAGQEISVPQAARKYGIASKNLWDWATAGYITILDNRKWSRKLDERDVAVIAELRRMGVLRQGRSLARVLAL